LTQETSQPEDRLVLRQVRCRDELEGALRLVHDNYVRCGYTAPQPGGLRVGVHYALPTTQCFVAVVRGEVFATASLFADGPLGLPADELYPDKLAELRLAGRKIGEVGMLADRRREQSRSFPTLLRMMKRIFWTVLDAGLDDLVITVNPKHAEFYKQMLCFEDFGPLRSYASVGNAPALLLRVNLTSLDPDNARDAGIRRLFLTPLAAEERTPQEYLMPDEDVRYFLAEKSDLLRRLRPDQREALQQQRPDLDLDALAGPRKTRPRGRRAPARHRKA